MTNFDAQAFWDARYGRGETSGRGSYGDEASLKIGLIREAADAAGVTSITDIGPGDGNIAFQLLAWFPGVTYHGVDLARTVVDRNNENARRLELQGVSFHVGNAADPATPIPDADMVVCLDVLHHVPTREAHDAIVRRALLAARKVAVFAAWGPQAKESREATAPHCFYHPFMQTVVGDGVAFCPPSNNGFPVFDFEIHDVPTDPLKQVIVLTRRLTPDEPPAP